MLCYVLCYHRTFGTTNSIASHERNRLLMSFESISDAKLRTANKEGEIAKRKKNHVGKFESYEFDIESCVKEV